MTSRRKVGLGLVVVLVAVSVAGAVVVVRGSLALLNESRESGGAPDPELLDSSTCTWLKAAAPFALRFDSQNWAADQDVLDGVFGMTSPPSDRSVASSYRVVESAARERSDGPRPLSPAEYHAVEVLDDWVDNC